MLEYLVLIRLLLKYLILILIILSSSAFAEDVYMGCPTKDFIYDGKVWSFNDWYIGGDVRPLAGRYFLAKMSASKSKFGAPATCIYTPNGEPSNDQYDGKRTIVMVSPESLTLVPGRGAWQYYGPGRSMSCFDSDACLFKMIN